MLMPSAEGDDFRPPFALPWWTFALFSSNFCSVLMQCFSPHPFDLVSEILLSLNCLRRRFWIPCDNWETSDSQDEDKIKKPVGKQIFPRKCSYSLYSSLHKTYTTQLKTEWLVVLKSWFMKETPRLHWECSLTQKDFVPRNTPWIGPCLFLTALSKPMSGILVTPEIRDPQYWWHVTKWPESEQRSSFCWFFYLFSWRHRAEKLSNGVKELTAQCPTQPTFVTLSNLTWKALKIVPGVRRGRRNHTPPVPMLT